MWRPLAVLTLLAAVVGCTSTREVRALRGVDFRLADVGEARLAGRPIGDIERPGDLSPGTLAAIAASLARGTLPLSFNVVVAARNPADNPPARLTRFDWTLYLDEQQAVQGVYDDERAIAPGDSTVFSVPVAVDLVQLAGDRGPELIDLAFALAGRRADPSRIRLAARPTLSTPLGRIRADEVTVLTRAVGGRRALTDSTGAHRTGRHPAAADSIQAEPR